MAISSDDDQIDLVHRGGDRGREAVDLEIGAERLPQIGRFEQAVDRVAGARQAMPA